MTQATLRIATRKSPLALWQAEYVKRRLEAAHSDLVVSLVPMSTRGDKILDTPLAKIGGKGLFIKELEHALLAGEADIAVHSMKDVPMEFEAEFCLGVICEREDPRDAFVSNRYESWQSLPQNAVVGTCSLRRKAQLLAVRPDLQITDLRGNVQTRLNKLDAGEFDAIVLAAAGLIRLEMAERIAQYIEPEMSLPAAGQGAVGIELRSNDPLIANYIAVLDDATTAYCVSAERALSRRLGGGCQVPIAAYATRNGDELKLTARVASVDGETVLEVSDTAGVDAADELGNGLAEKLLAMGADKILAAIYESEQS